MRQRFIVILIMTAIVLLLGASGMVESSDELQPEVAIEPFYGQQSLSDVQQNAAEASLQCVEPASPIQPSCELLERQILAATVRYEIYWPSRDGTERQVQGLGHGTVKDGRYLVVHNHFGVDLSSFESESQDAVITMYNGIGDLFQWRVSPRITVVVEEAEVLVLDFGQRGDGEGFFESLGIQSAMFESWQDAAPQAGQIVAQVVWDGQRSDVTWTSIDDVILNDGTPRVVLANPLLHGASGGGVFLDGSQIAVNWQRGLNLDETGAVVEQFSTAALYTPMVAAQGIS